MKYFLIIVLIYIITVIGIAVCFYKQEENKEIYKTVGDLIDDLEIPAFIPFMNTILFIFYIIMLIFYKFIWVNKLEKLYDKIRNIKL